MGKRKRTTGRTNQLTAKEKGIPRNLKANQTKSQRLGSEQSRLSAYTTRSGRKVVKPVAAWRGERILYDQGSLDAGTLVLPSIQNVIRKEETDEPRRMAIRHPNRRPQRSRSLRKIGKLDNEDDANDEEDTLDGEEQGIVNVSVMRYDPETDFGNDKDLEDQSIAYSADVIDHLIAESKDRKNGAWRVIEVIHVPFLGCGFIHMPPNSTKNTKNSGFRQIVFFVFEGRVMVEIGRPDLDMHGKRFSIGHGSQWFVPR
ncbi:MAG: hypothetical protein Q9180_009285, partial [Flavoplaca navasiana]